MIHADLHLHTEISRDSTLSPDKLLQACKRRALECVAVTDHNAIAGAVALARQAPPEMTVIIGEEVNTAQGELLGFFLREMVPGGLSARETALEIRSQGGVVGVPHPCDTFRRAVDTEVLRALQQEGLLDFLEGRNGRSVRPRFNERAEELGRELGLPLSAGSDAHSAREVAACYVLMPSFSTPEEFLASLAEGRLIGRPSSFWIRMRSMAEWLWRRARGR